LATTFAAASLSEFHVLFIPEGWSNGMEKVQKPNTRKSSGVRIVSTFAITTHSINDAFADLLRPFSAKEIARRLRLPSARTVENWKEGRTSPQAKHVVAMLSDDELCKRLLKLGGQDDLVRSKETIDALKAALVSEGK
jgi:hypothetical protein